ncbi:uncharacterized protein Z518_09978 [Rhinocladiella mackenziei CBS 650.93]|uniref:Transcriptional regulator n=1 Tax=Rhinocladiella mackenziei CBS 650.93 TaxID=1442369 RepID=A0A0D2GRH4_9EURO|nr:uncharacterized protein Z518_09978 [Rhinocladiella mackenziei CBS 650.93]KIX00913.1 hypothetical protein Z518_09978 [Rhinocladiella mackenziei CBS 650.93]
MSDSELPEASESPAPPAHELEKSLRRETVKAQKSDPNFSYNSIRAASEAKLGLRKGFYKNHEEWASRSKKIIQEQLVIKPHGTFRPRLVDVVKAIQDDTRSSPLKSAKSKSNESKERPKKRALTENEPTPTKRQKTGQRDDTASEDMSSPLSDIDSEIGEEKPRRKKDKAPPKSGTAKSKQSAAKKSKSAGSDSEEEDGEEKAKGAGAENSTDQDDVQGAVNPDDGSASDMSVPLGEDPNPKKKRKLNESKSTGRKPKKTKVPKGKADADLDPDQAEIKRLQGWLGKCGIRKLWGKELKPYETSKAKIKHLREMLANIGMTGRYSIDKANQIREARELAADIEAVQEGAERWGADEDDGGRNEKQDGRPARRLVRGAKNYDFLSSDGEETD